MKKKLSALFLACVLTLTAFAGCTSGNSSSSESEKSTSDSAPDFMSPVKRAILTKPV